MSASTGKGFQWCKCDFVVRAYAETGRHLKQTDIREHIHLPDGSWYSYMEGPSRMGPTGFEIADEKFFLYHEWLEQHQTWPELATVRKLILQCNHKTLLRYVEIALRVIDA